VALALAFAFGLAAPAFNYADEPSKPAPTTPLKGKGRGKLTPEQREKLKEKFKNLTPEQKEALKEKAKAKKPA